MNREDIIKLANKAYGIDEEGKPFHPSALLHLEIFAALVASAEREACIKAIEDQIGWDMDDPESTAIKAIREMGQA